MFILKSRLLNVKGKDINLLTTNHVQFLYNLETI